MADVYDSYRESQLRQIAKDCQGKAECGSCAHWKWTDAWGGQCQRVFAKDMPFHAEARLGGLKSIGEDRYLIADTMWLHTGMHFGCKLHQAATPEAPKAAEETRHCKNCKHWYEEWGYGTYCARIPTMRLPAHDPEWFCKGWAAKPKHPTEIVK